ncbi:MAG TPA: DUF4383 domain-containing protein [Pyrinomonadaceae bacterium]
MAKTVATILGVAFILIGLLGFVAPGMMGMHLNVVHNLVHLISGALALYLGLRGTLAAARTFCIAFGAVYALLGIAGYLFGGDATSHTVDVPAHASEASLWKVIGGTLELAAPEHGLHILLGIVFLVGGLLTRGDVRAAVRDAT